MLNKVQLIGRLGKDPEVRNLETGKAVANFSIACSEKWKDKNTGDVKEKTEWVNCVAWDPLADKVIAKYIHKGDLVYVEGKLQTRKWEKEGVTHYSTEVLISSLVMLNTKKDSENNQAFNKEPAKESYNSQSDKTRQQQYTPHSSDATDDLPF